MYSHLKMYMALTFLLALFLVAYANHGSLRVDPFNTLPDSNTASFRTNSRIIWDHEQAQQEGRYHNSYIFSGGLHGTVAGLTTEPIATEAFVPERINQSGAAITYNALANDVCWTIISAANAGITGWTRVGTTAYYYNCQGSTSPSQPTLPSNSAWLMGPITITASAITTVIDKRVSNPQPWAFISITDNIYGAVGNGVTDSYTAIQGAINYAQSREKHTKILFPCGIYRVNTGLVITQPAYLTLEGPSQKCVYIFHRGTDTGGAIQVTGTATTSNVSAVRKSIANAPMWIKNLSIGSTAGPALRFVDAGRVWVQDVQTFSAGTGGANAFISIDGGENLVFENVQSDPGNDSYPQEYNAVLQNVTTRALNNIRITSTIDANGRYSLVDELYFINSRSDGQATGASISALFTAGQDFVPEIHFIGGKYTQENTNNAANAIFDLAQVNASFIQTTAECSAAVACNGWNIHSTGSSGGSYHLTDVYGKSSARVNLAGDGLQSNIVSIQGGDIYNIANSDNNMSLLRLVGVTMRARPTGAIGNYTDSLNVQVLNNILRGLNVEPLFSMVKLAGGVNAGPTGSGTQFTHSATNWSDTVDGVFQETVKARGVPSGTAASWSATDGDNISSHYFRAYRGGATRNVAAMFVDAPAFSGNNARGRIAFDIFETDGSQNRELSIGSTTIQLRCVTLTSLGTSVMGLAACCSDCNPGTSPCTAGGTGGIAFGITAGAWRCP